MPKKIPATKRAQLHRKLDRILDSGNADCVLSISETIIAMHDYSKHQHTCTSDPATIADCPPCSHISAS
jgi:hypothetical protein